ncbi:MAG TPA: hypothetical protein VNF29_05800 [Candidatus Binataceae bacterium]|nr:hypothetical protein [Candidatus Binataceae bacterium]
MCTTYRRIAILALAALGLSASGCPALMIPSLAYQGYKYEKTGSLTGQPAASPSSSQTRGPAAQSTPSETDIE